MRMPKWGYIAWLGVVFLVFLLGTEQVLSLRDDDAEIRQIYGLGRRVAPLREWVPDASAISPAPATRFAHPGPEVSASYRLDIDKDGFIVPSRVHADPEATIVFLGGSTTECFYVAPENRFAYLAGRLLEAATGLRLNSYNGGHSGNDALHSLHLLVTKVLPMRPDIVVLMHGINDLGHLSRAGTYWPAEGDTALIQGLPSGVSSVLAEIRSRVLPHTWLAVHRVVERLSGGGWSAQAAGLPVTRPDVERFEADFRSALTGFVRLARAWGIEPVLMTEMLSGSADYQVRAEQGGYLDPGRLAEHALTVGAVVDLHARFDDIVRDVAAREGAVLIDLSARLPANPDTVYDGMHFHDGGSRQVAALIAHDLEPLIRRLHPPQRP